MRNLRPSKKNSFDTYKEIVSSKRDKDLVSRLSLLDDIIKKQLSIYEERFLDNSLETVSALTLKDSESKDLKSLYGIRLRVIRDLKKELTTDDENRIMNTCQYCTINSISALDHYLPRSEYAEFVVNPKNLFPICPECNSKKTHLWRISSGRLFLNLYLDELPTKQYLYVRFLNDFTEFQFFLKNNTGIEDELFSIIENHYGRLDLCKRFRENSNEILTELRLTLKQYKNSNLFETIKISLIEALEESKDNFGHNYWKIIFKLALLKNENFLNNI